MIIQSRLINIYIYIYLNIKSASKNNLYKYDTHKCHGCSTLGWKYVPIRSLGTKKVTH